MEGEHKVKTIKEKEREGNDIGKQVFNF